MCTIRPANRVAVLLVVPSGHVVSGAAG